MGNKDEVIRMVGFGALSAGRGAHSHHATTEGSSIHVRRRVGIFRGGGKVPARSEGRRAEISGTTFNVQRKRCCSSCTRMRGI